MYQAIPAIFPKIENQKSNHNQSILSVITSHLFFDCAFVLERVLPSFSLGDTTDGAHLTLFFVLFVLLALRNMLFVPPLLLLRL